MGRGVAVVTMCVNVSDGSNEHNSIAFSLQHIYLRLLSSREGSLRVAIQVVEIGSSKFSDYTEMLSETVIGRDFRAHELRHSEVLVTRALTSIHMGRPGPSNATSHCLVAHGIT